MKLFFSKKYFFFLIHLSAWVIYLLFNYSLYLVEEGYLPFYSYFTKYLICVITFYGMSYGIQKVVVYKQWGVFIIMILLTYLNEFSLRIFIGYVVNPWIEGYTASFKEFSFLFSITGSLWWWFQFTMFATAYSISKIFVTQEREKNKIILEKKEKEAENLLLQQEKLQLEYAFLRSQINPHTLHNIFNMLYSKSIMANVPELGDAILLVSNLMRYSLETATDENGCVLLDKEIEQIQNTIKINQLRSSDNLQINFEITGDTSQAKIIPLVLISLVENAFKYAELTEASHPLQLKINTEDNSFVFYMHNKKKTVVVNETSHGIGQGNTIQRLKAAYGENGYEMKISQDETTYTLQLTIYNLNKEPIRTPATLAQPATVLTA